MEIIKNAKISFKFEGEEYRFNGGPTITKLNASCIYTVENGQPVICPQFTDHKERLYVDLMKNGVMNIYPESEFVPVPEGCVLRFIVKVGEGNARIVHIGDKTPILTRKDLCGCSDEPSDRFANDCDFNEGGFRD